MAENKSFQSSNLELDSVRQRQPSQKSGTKSESLPNVVITEELTLKRHLNLWSGICFIVGIIIGSGIFVSPKNVYQNTDSVGLCLTLWVTSGIVALLGALCFAEIGLVIPRSGAELAYMKEGIGSVHARVGDIIAYLFNWTNTLILKPTSAAVLTLTFSEYLLKGFMDSCSVPPQLIKMVAIFTILILMNINSISVSAANRLNILFVICKVSTILFVIVVGLVRLMQGNIGMFKTKADDASKEMPKIASAFYFGLWAYDGWNSLNSVTEELKNPKRNLWLSIVLALPSVIVLYLLTNISYFTVMSKAELLTSSAVAVTWGEYILGRFARILSVMIAISALGSANGTLFASARYCMVGAQYGYLPEIFSCIQKQRLTPLPGIVLQGVISILFCIPSDIERLIDVFSFSAWIFYGLTFVATLCCKFTMKDAERVINVPIPIVVIVILVSIYLVVEPVRVNPSVGFLVAILLIFSGLIFYYPFVYHRKEIQCMTKITKFLETFFDLQLAAVNID